MNKIIYLDYAATTPVDPRVAEKMQRYLTIDGVFGNPSSTHAFGLAAKEAIEHARFQVADLIGAEAKEMIWTSGATEAINLALKGAAKLYQQKGKHIITVKIEHPAVLDSCQQLEKEGFSVTYLTPQKNGLLDLAAVESAIRDDTILISVMHVNNEIGVIQDIASIGKLSQSRGILFHVDAAQSAGKIPINVNEMHIDLLSCCAHKVYGPKGIGALYVRSKPRVRVAGQIHGGGQEHGMRSGTLPAHQIVGMGEAFALAKNEMENDYQRLFTLRNQLLETLSQSKAVTINGDPQHCVPGIINLCIPGKNAKEIMAELPGFAISAGSACGAKGNEPSYVLRALGLSHADASSSVRISLGKWTTEADVILVNEQIRRYLS